MARVVQRTRDVVSDDVETTDQPAKTQEVIDTDTNIAARIVSIIGGIIIGLLALRFVLSLLGANRTNAFADLIYTVSYPFAAPFFGLFGRTPRYGDSRFEIETLFAIVIYALITWLIIRLVTVAQRQP